MHCPKCGTENSDGAQSRRSCAQDLSDTALPAQMTSSQTSVLAIVALVLGISSILLVFLTGIPAIICAIVALVKIKQSSGRLKGRGIAITGIVVPAVWLPLILIAIFLPSLRITARYTRDVRQKTQLRSIEAALELFKSQFDSYPPSEAMDDIGVPYCGAMKLCEAVMGRDLLGFHKNSVFRSNGMDAAGSTQLYPRAKDAHNLKSREGPLLPADHANAHQLKDIYENVGLVDGNNYLICGTYTKRRHTAKVAGMPILYYRADTSKTVHDVNDPNNPENIYNYKDNYDLLALGVPGKSGNKHPLFEDPRLFYEMTRNYRVTTQSAPNRPDSFILLSAGKDGLYGTEDDILNFTMQWKHKR